MFHGIQFLFASGNWVQLITTENQKGLLLVSCMSGSVNGHYLFISMKICCMY